MKNIFLIGYPNIAPTELDNYINKQFNYNISPTDINNYFNKQFNYDIASMDINLFSNVKISPSGATS
ncbi:MAG: hypothetical protein MUE53_07420 [Chitinophagales bacterium]|jgi:hypothetical protein|nr:hypothetical protein [Chitinophagales bacterium]